MTDRYVKRVDRFRKVLHREKADSIPVLGTLDQRFFAELQGKSLLTALWNLEELLDCYLKGVNYFQYDCCLGIDLISPRLYSILGSNSWFQDPVEGFMQHIDLSPMTQEDYPGFIDDPLGCIIQTILPRKYKNLEDANQWEKILPKAIKNYFHEISNFYLKMEEISYLTEVPIILGTTMYAPFDLLADYLRGITGVSYDIFQFPDYIEKACEKILSLILNYIRNSFPPPENGFPLVCGWVHLPPIIGTDHFRRFFWPTFKSLCEMLVSDGYNLYIHFQGDYQDNSYFELLHQLPKGKCILSFEKCDLKEIKRVDKGAHCIAATFPIEYLNSASLSDCIEKAKELIEIADQDGGCVFTFDKPPMSITDAEPEKIKSLVSFVQDYYGN